MSHSWIPSKKYSGVKWYECEFCETIKAPDRPPPGWGPGPPTYFVKGKEWMDGKNTDYQEPPCHPHVETLREEKKKLAEVWATFRQILVVIAECARCQAYHDQIEAKDLPPVE